MIATVEYVTIVNAVPLNFHVLALLSHAGCRSTIRGARKMQSNFLNGTLGHSKPGISI